MILKRFLNKDSERWFLLAGLGNPGREYENTRHNIGFAVIQNLSRKWGIDINRYRFKSLTGDGEYNGMRVALVLPQTFMNNSGTAISSFMRFYKLDPGNLLVIHDDLDLPFGSIRLRKSGGSAGQKGMQSIIEKLGTSEFPRLRVGIGRPPGRMDAVDYVLKKFKRADQNLLNQVLDHSADAIETYLEQGIEKAMTRFNHSLLNEE